MTNLEIFETKAEFNKWLNELTEIEKLLIIEMLNEARELGKENINTASCQITAMDNLVKPLNWIDNPKKRFGEIYKVMSRADVPMPHTVRNACIEITEQTYPYNYYEAVLWCFNQGIGIGEGKSVDEAKHNAFKWWVKFVSGFLNCP